MHGLTHICSEALKLGAFKGLKRTRNGDSWARPPLTLSTRYVSAESMKTIRADAAKLRLEGSSARTGKIVMENM